MPPEPHPSFPYVVLPRELGQMPPAPSVVGEKAARLCELLVLKARVPRFGVVTAHAFDALCANPELVRLRAAAPADVLGDEAARLVHGEGLMRALLTAPLAPALEAAIHEVLQAFPDDDLLAVRASPLGDAPERAAVAGALDTLLCVRRGDDAAFAVRQCFASAFAPAVLAARYAAGLDPTGTRLAVIVQRMVQSEVSGSVSSVDAAAEGDAGAHLVIEATYGLSGGSSRGAGERRISMDRYRVTRPLDASELSAATTFEQQALIDEDIAEKQEAVRFDDDVGHGTVVRPVPSEERGLATLSAAQVRALCLEALRLERDVGRPLRLVFAFSGRLLHLLEARVLVATQPRLASQRVRLWDQRLLPGGLAGPTTPLTYSLVRRTASRVAQAALRDLGAGAHRPSLFGGGSPLELRRSAADRLFGYLSGRVYANVMAFRELLELLPWREQALSAVSRGFGVPDLHEREPAGARPREPDGDDAEQELASLGRIGRLLRKVDDDAAGFLPGAGERLAALRAMTVPPAAPALDPDRLLDLLDDVEELLARSGTSLALLSAGCAAQYDLVQRLLHSGGLDEGQRLLNDMLGGEPDEHALGLTRAVLDLVQLARAEPALDEALRTGDTSRAVLQRLPTLRAAGVFVARLDEAVHLYGQQTLSGLKLESSALRTRPELLIDMVRAARAAKMPDLDGLVASAGGTRKKAEYLLEGQLRPRALFGVSSRHRVALRATARLRVAVARREQVRRVLSESVGVARDVVLSLGERLFEHDLIDQPADVLFLTVEEIRGLIRGASVDDQPRALITARKREAARAPVTMPDRLCTTGVVATAVPVALELPGDDGAAHTLYGIPISSGEASGRAVVLRAPDERSYATPFVPDSVIVTERLDAGHLPRLVAARAVVVEGASVLDHVAVALRALGIPVVGGIARASEHIEAGELLHVDGGAGKVHLVRRMPAEEAPASDAADPEDFARLAAPSDPEIVAYRRERTGRRVLEPTEPLLRAPPMPPPPTDPET